MVTLHYAARVRILWQDWVKPLPVSKSQRSQEDGHEASLEELYPEIYQKIKEISVKLIEDYGYAPQEIEFTFESEKPEDLYLLQTRDLDMEKHQALNVFKSQKEKMKLAGRGIGIGGSAMNGARGF